jgi:hypothetical protein
LWTFSQSHYRLASTCHSFCPKFASLFLHIKQAIFPGKDAKTGELFCVALCGGLVSFFSRFSVDLQHEIYSNFLSALEWHDVLKIRKIIFENPNYNSNAETITLSLKKEGM